MCSSPAGGLRAEAGKKTNIFLVANPRGKHALGSTEGYLRVSYPPEQVEYKNGLQKIITVSCPVTPNKNGGSALLGLRGIAATRRPNGNRRKATAVKQNNTSPRSTGSGQVIDTEHTYPDPKPCAHGLSLGNPSSTGFSPEARPLSTTPLVGPLPPPPPLRRCAS